jgi:hypothetical protein
MTFLAALRHDRIDAPWFIEGPVDGESFRLYVKEVLSASRNVGVATRPRDLAVNRPKYADVALAVENACLNLMGLTAQKRQSLIKHGLPRACLVRFTFVKCVVSDTSSAAANRWLQPSA